MSLELTGVHGLLKRHKLFTHKKIETALGIHHAKAKKKNYILMTGAFAVCITLFLTFSTLVV